MTEPCPFCSEPYELGVLELYPAERTFTMTSCCEGAYHDAIDQLNDGVPRREFASWFEGETGIAVRQLVLGPDGGLRYGNAGFTVDYGLELGTIRRDDAKAFVRQHHRHASRPPCSWRWGHAVRNGGELVGVAMVGRPVARKLDHHTIVEVNRVCVDDTMPGGLRWNACSMLYGAAVREAKRRGFERVITYTLEHEDGTTLRAAGFEPVMTTKGGSWDRPSRRRCDAAPTCPKVRWERATNTRRRRPRQLALPEVA